MDYTQFTFHLKDNADSAIFSAYLQIFEVNSIWEEKDKVHAYFDNENIANFNGNFLQELSQKTVQFASKVEEVENKKINWNEEWESNFPVVKVDDLAFIYADFHEKEAGFSHYIKIAPKMAFGTGHHETTYMMIQSMKDINYENSKVLDLGCGTGILSVLAGQLGSKDIIAIDIEEPSYENTKEHAEINDIPMHVICGGVEDVPKQNYDIILANINRTVLLTYADDIISLLSEGGDLLLSGILKEDESLIREAYSKVDLLKINNRGNWLCFHLKSRNQ